MGLLRRWAASLISKISAKIPTIIPDSVTMTVWRSQGGSPAICMSGLTTRRLSSVPIAELPMVVKKNRLLKIFLFISSRRFASLDVNRRIDRLLALAADCSHPCCAADGVVKRQTIEHRLGRIASAAIDLTGPVPRAPKNPECEYGCFLYLFLELRLEMPICASPRTANTNQTM